jgi:hypothetical protein
MNDSIIEGTKEENINECDMKKNLYVTFIDHEDNEKSNLMDGKNNPYKQGIFDEKNENLLEQIIRISAHENAVKEEFELKKSLILRGLFILSQSISFILLTVVLIYYLLKQNLQQAYDYFKPTVNHFQTEVFCFFLMWLIIDGKNIT